MTSGDWSDTNPKPVTDRTQLSIDLVERIEQLTSELNHLKTLCWNVFYGEDFVSALDNLRKEIEK